MSDFLQNLLERSLGQSDSIRPRTPYRYESEGLDASDQDAEEVLTDEDSLALSSPPSSERQAESYPSSAAQQAFVPDERESFLAATDEESSRNEPLTDTSPLQTQLVDNPEQSASPIQPMPEMPEPELPEFQPEEEPIQPVISFDEDQQSPLIAEREPNTDESGSGITKEDKQPTPLMPAADLFREETGSSAEPAFSATPTVKVTIGRIEIQANRPPTPSVPKKVNAQPKPKFRPAMSLDDYMKKRSGGR